MDGLESDRPRLEFWIPIYWLCDLMQICTFGAKPQQMEAIIITKIFKNPYVKIINKTLVSLKFSH